MAIFCAGIVTSAALAAPAAEGEFPRSGTVAASTLNVRANPGLFYEVIAKLDQGATVEVFERRDQWCRIQAPPDAEAWVAKRFVDDDGTVTGDKVRVRAGAGVAFTPYHHLEKGRKITFAGGERNGWMRIEPPEQATAWVSARFVELAPAPPARVQEGDGESVEGEIEQAREQTDSDTDGTASTETTEAPDASEATAPPQSGGDPERKEPQIRATVASADDDGARKEQHLAESAISSRPQDVSATPADEVAANPPTSDDRSEEHPPAVEKRTKSPAEANLKPTEEQDVDLTAREKAAGIPQSRGIEMLPPIRLDADEAPVAEKRRATREAVVHRRRESVSEAPVQAGKHVPTSVTVVELSEDPTATEEVDAPPAESAKSSAEQADTAPTGAGKVGKPAEKRDGSEASEEADARMQTALRMQGVVVSLGEEANSAATHVLIERNEEAIRPTAYLTSANVDLDEWQGRALTVYGERIPCDWSLPLLRVTGVLLESR